MIKRICRRPHRRGRDHDELRVVFPLPSKCNRYGGSKRTTPSSLSKTSFFTKPRAGKKASTFIANSTLTCARAKTTTKARRRSPNGASPTSARNTTTIKPARPACRKRQSKLVFRRIRRQWGRLELSIPIALSFLTRCCRVFR
jgi:hypothetical protein